MWAWHCLPFWVETGAWLRDRDSQRLASQWCIVSRKADDIGIYNRAIWSRAWWTYSYIQVDKWETGVHKLPSRLSFRSPPLPIRKLCNQKGKSLSISCCKRTLILNKQSFTCWTWDATRRVWPKYINSQLLVHVTHLRAPLATENNTHLTGLEFPTCSLFSLSKRTSP